MCSLLLKDLSFNFIPDRACTLQKPYARNSKYDIIYVYEAKTTASIFSVTTIFDDSQLIAGWYFKVHNAHLSDNFH